MNKIDIFMKNGRRDLFPEKEHVDDAAADCRAAFSRTRTLYAGQTLLVPLGFSLSMPVGTEAQLRSRSGLAYKNGIIVLNSPATIDAGYAGEVKALIHNVSDEPFEVTPRMRICQMLFKEVPSYEINMYVGESDRTTERGSSGFGSTGTA